MKINCGLSKAEKMEQRRKELAEYLRRIEEWHDWFAWYPVRVGPKDCRWLEVVERRDLIRGIDVSYRAGRMLESKYVPSILAPVFKYRAKER